MTVQTNWETVNILKKVVTFQNNEGCYTILKSHSEKVLARNAKSEYVEMNRDHARNEWLKFKGTIPNEWLKNYVKYTHTFKVGQIVTGHDLHMMKDFNILHSTGHIDIVHECNVKGNTMSYLYNDDQNVSMNANRQYKVTAVTEESFTLESVRH